MRMLRWMIVLAALGAMAYLVVAVDIGGRTLLERVTGAHPPDERPADEVGSDGVQGAPDVGGQKSAPPAKASDALTEEDRADLTKLIEKRLDEDPDEAPPAESP